MSRLISLSVLFLWNLTGVVVGAFMTITIFTAFAGVPLFIFSVRSLRSTVRLLRSPDSPMDDTLLLTTSVEVLLVAVLAVALAQYFGMEPTDNRYAVGGVSGAIFVTVLALSSLYLGEVRVEREQLISGRRQN